MKACKGEDIFTLKNANSVQAHGLCFKNKDAYLCQGTSRARSYMFSVHDPGKMFSKQVLGTGAFRLRAL